jgi:hypothetical protein
MPAVRAVWFVIPEARSPHFIYTVIKLLLILIKLKNLLVNETPGAHPITADLLHFFHSVDVMIHVWALLWSRADFPSRINVNHKKLHI